MSAERFGRPQGSNSRFAAMMLLGLFGLGLQFAVRPAHAQVYPCSGPGPGEVVVGMSQGGNGVASVPLCQRVDQGGEQTQSYQAAPVRQPDVYMAVVTHPDTTKYWASMGYSTAADAKNKAMKACTLMMGEGCDVAAAWSNLSVIVVAEDVAGNVFAEGAPTFEKAGKAVLKICQQYSTGCHGLGVVRNEILGGHDQFPTGPIQRRLFASLARTKDTPPEKWDDAAWLASGQSGYKAAEDAALGACRKDTGMECEVRVTVGNGLIARVIDDANHILWLNVSAPEVMEKQVRNNCPKGRECRLIDTFDARTPRVTTIQLSESESSVRGFFSLARPVDDTADKAWGKRALVTGRASRDAARQAAIDLCQAESKSPCEATPKDGDRGADQFMVVLRNGAGDAKLYFGASADDVKKRKKEGCAKDNQSCPSGEMVDLAKPVTTLLSI